MSKNYTEGRKIVCSFSGGETSAYMAILLKDKYKDNVQFTFANTGEENEETLIFADKVDRKYGLDLVWLEAKVNMEDGAGTTYKTVNFKTASRTGRPFEDVIKKYGLPNPVRGICTRELKVRPLDKWANDNAGRDHLKAIGIRVDEIDRVAHDYKERGLYYPLAFEWPTTKNEINRFWRDQDFRLDLKHYQGNCKVCYKKSFRKLAWIYKENPQHFDFMRRMEKECALIRPGTKGERVRIYRDHKTIDEIEEMSQFASEPIDDARLYEVNRDLFGYDHDLDACGSESCEVY